MSLSPSPDITAVRPLQLAGPDAIDILHPKLTLSVFADLRPGSLIFPETGSMREGSNGKTVALSFLANTTRIVEHPSSSGG
jgi:hypothetical protein